MEKVAPWIVTALSLLTMLVFLWAPLDPNEGKVSLPAPTQSAQQQQTASVQASGTASGKEADDQKPDPNGRRLLRMLAALTSASIVLWGMHCFVGDPYALRRRQVGFAYFVMIASFVVFAVPLVVRNQAIGTEPIGVLSACVLGDGGEKLLSCRSAAPIGECDKLTVPADALKCERARKTANFQWVLNVGGTLSMPEGGISESCAKDGNNVQCKLGSQQNRAAVTGGIVVPLPFLVIALIGGAISMSRRIPEIQKRSEDDYVGTAEEPKLMPCEVREYLAFQIIQFISAPLLAIVAYQVIHPESESTAAALAFMSGFGSESVLLAIRGVFDGIKSKSAPALPSTATLSGVVRHGTAPVAGAIVKLAAGAQSTLSNTNGSYSFSNVALGAGKISVTSGGTRADKAFNMPASGTSCDIDLVADAVPVPTPAPAPTTSSGAPPLPYDTTLRISIQADNIDAGSLKLLVDGNAVAVGDDHLIEVPLRAGVLHAIVATATRASQPVETHFSITPTAMDDKRLVAMKL
jgi:hypothetical protein